MLSLSSFNAEVYSISFSLIIFLFEEICDSLHCTANDICWLSLDGWIDEIFTYLKFVLGFINFGNSFIQQIQINIQELHHFFLLISTVMSKSISFNTWWNFSLWSRFFFYYWVRPSARRRGQFWDCLYEQFYWSCLKLKFLPTAVPRPIERSLGHIKAATFGILDPLVTIMEEYWLMAMQNNFWFQIHKIFGK